MADNEAPAVSSVVANTVAIISESFRFPGRDAEINLDTGEILIPKGTMRTLDAELPQKPPPKQRSWEPNSQSRSAPPKLDVTRQKPTPKRASVNPIPSSFKLVFVSVVLITVFAMAVSLVLAILYPTTTANLQSVFEAAGFTWKAGVGAVFGLLGGKVTK